MWDGISCKKLDSLNWFSVILFPMIPNECPQDLGYHPSSANRVSALWRIAAQAVSLTKRGFRGAFSFFLQNTLQFSFWEYLSNMRIEPKHHVSWDTQPGIPGCLGLGLKSSILETSSQMIFQF